MEITKQIVRHLTANMEISKKNIIIGNFIGGFAWGVGTVLGAIVIGAILFYILKPLGIFDAVVKPGQELNPLRQQLNK